MIIIVALEEQFLINYILHTYMDINNKIYKYISKIKPVKFKWLIIYPIYKKLNIKSMIRNF